MNITKRQFHVRLLALAVLAVFAATSMGCTTTTVRAIEHRKLSLSAQMSDTVFLDPATLYKNRNIFVRVTNTSDFQDIKFGEILKGKFVGKGYSITTNPAEAGYIVQANLLYMGEEREGMTGEGMLVGGFGGAVLGSEIGGLGGALIGGGLAGIAGGFLGAAIGVDTYLGVVDIQIKEIVDGKVTGVMITEARHGSATVLKTEREIGTQFQEYRTRIVVTATQTNIDRELAVNAIADRLATQITGKF